METDTPLLALQQTLAAWSDHASMPLWLVGGAVRDALLGRLVRDLDLVVAGDARRLAHDLARTHRGHLAVLDNDAAVVRVVFDHLPIAFDIAQLRGADLAADLRARDFTLNALAVPVTSATLAAVLAGARVALAPHIIDPCAGRADLAAKRLRVVSPSALRDDPVRVLRAARFAALFDLEIVPETLALAREVGPLLLQMPPARLTAEFYAMLANPRGTRAMRWLDVMGALTVLVPPLEPCRGVIQGRLHHWDVFEHTLEVIDSLDRAVALLETGLNRPEVPATPDATGRVAHPVALDLGGHNADLLRHVRQPLAEGHTRLTALKVATLFHDIGKPLTRVTLPDGDFRFPGHPEAGVPLAEAVLDTWQVGKTLRRFATTVVEHHMRPGQLVGSHNDLGRAIRQYFHDAEPAALDIALFSIADHLAVYGPTPLTPFWIKHRAAVAEVVRRAYDEPERIWPARLIDGNDLIARLGVPPGPEIGRILAAVRDAQWDGAITTRAEALALAGALAQTEHIPLNAE